jgi:AcrR family transcriptional regulator
MSNRATDKRAIILQAALDIFAEYGFHGSPTSLIVERAGVGAGTLYRYFASKDEMILELHRELDEKVNAVAFAGYSGTIPLPQRFFHLFENLLRHFLLHPTEFRFLEQFYNSPYGIAKKRARLENPDEKQICFDALFREARDRGIFKELPVVMLISLAVGPMVLVFRDHLAGFLAINDRLITAVVQSCWDAVARSPSAEPGGGIEHPVGVKL